MKARALATTIGLALAACIAASTARPAHAAAQSYGPPTGAFVGVFAAGLTYTIVSAELVGEAIDKATHHGYGLFPTGATFELVWGAAHMLGVAALVAVGAADRNPNDMGGYLAASLAIGIVGAWFMGHAIWSLTGGDPRHRASAPTITVCPVRAGAVVVLDVVL